MTETYFRDATLESAISAPPGSVERTIKLSFASELPVLRSDAGGKFWEVLSLGPGDCRLDLLRSVGLLFADHNERQIIGELERNSAQIDPDRKVRSMAKVRDPVWIQYIDDAASKIGVSVGYTLSSLLREEISPADGLPIRFYAWRPYEVSLLSPGVEPADSTVGINRAKTFMNTNSLESALRLALSGSRQTGDDFSDVSICDTLLQLGYEPSGRIKEMHRSISNIGGALVNHAIPFSALATRDFTAGVAAAGGFFVQDDVQEPTPLVFSRSVLRRAGAQFITGLQGNYLKPKVASAPVPSRLSEIAAVAASNITTEADTLKPCRVTADVMISKQLLRDGGPAAEASVRKTLIDAINNALDRDALFGQAANEMLGIMNRPGIGAVAFNGAATWAKVVGMEQTVADMNLDGGNMAYVVSPSTRAKWKTIPKTAGTARFIAEDGRCNEYRILASSQLSLGHQAIFAAWDTIQVLIWGNGIDLLFNPYTPAKQGEVEVTALLWANVLPLYSQAIVATSDPANT